MSTTSTDIHYGTIVHTFGSTITAYYPPGMQLVAYWGDVE